jgi:hypothetical protein
VAGHSDRTPWLAGDVANSMILGKPYITAGKLIGWADMNLTAAIGQMLVRPFGQGSDFTPWSKVLSVEHRVSIIDPW